MSFTNRTLFNILQRDGVLKPGRALDLGCGRGRDAEILSQNNFIVDAVDADSDVIKFVPVTSTVSPVVSRIEDYKIKPDSYQLISCQYVLHFLPKKTAHRVIRGMVDGTARTGVVSFNLLGEKDDWKNKWTTWKRREMDTFLRKLPVSVHKIITEEGNGMTRAGTMKYWHVLNYVLIKK